MQMRDYQQECFDNTMDAFQHNQSVLNVMATGLGKTIVFSHLAKEFLKTGRIMVIAHREELIRQGQDKIGLVTGEVAQIEMGQEFASRGWGKSNIIVSTVQTQCAGRNGGRMTDFEPEEFSLLVIDEAHHAVANTYKRVIDYYKQNPKIKVLGVTATPDRTDEMALKQMFDVCSFDYGIREGIDDGWLVQIEQISVFVDGLDYSNVGMKKDGDFNIKQLAAVMEYEECLHGIASPCLDLCGDRKTLVFAASVAHAERLTEIFNRHKPNCAQFVCGTTPKDIRRDMFLDYKNGRFQYLVNVGVATEGFDEPDIQVVVMARPTKSRCLYTQMAGRGTRPSRLTAEYINSIETSEERRRVIKDSDKPNLTIIDFVGNCGRHKLITSADILGGKYEDEVVELAKQTAQEKTGPVDIITELQEAENELKRRARLEEESGIRKKLTARAKYSTAKVNPFDIFDIEPERERAWNKNRQPTTKQLEVLHKNGIDTAGLSFAHAHQMMDMLVKQTQEGKPTYKMLKVIQRNKFPDNLTYAEAGIVMDAAAKANKWFRLSGSQRADVMLDIEKSRNPEEVPF